MEYLSSHQFNHMHKPNWHAFYMRHKQFILNYNLSRGFQCSVTIRSYRISLLYLACNKETNSMLRIRVTSYVNELWPSVTETDQWAANMRTWSKDCSLCPLADMESAKWLYISWWSFGHNSSCGCSHRYRPFYSFFLSQINQNRALTKDRTTTIRSWQTVKTARSRFPEVASYHRLCRRSPTPSPPPFTICWRKVGNEIVW